MELVDEALDDAAARFVRYQCHGDYEPREDSTSGDALIYIQPFYMEDDIALELRAP